MWRWRSGVVSAAVAGATVLGVSGLAFGANIGQLPAGAVNHPVEVGPASGENGFPVWYRDSNGVRLEGCSQAEDPLCAIPAGEMPVADAPTSWPDNFPVEHFYMLAQSDLTLTGGGSVVLTTGVEGTFANEQPVDGDQITFGRVRIVVKGARPDTAYTFKHPYGVDVITTDGTGAGRLVEDVGIAAPGDFTGVLKSRVGPFLKWTSGAPAGYIGNPDVLHAVTGSPYLDEVGAPQNYLRAVSEPGPTGVVTDDRTDQFSLAGRLATNAGVTADQAVYTPNGMGGSIDVFARSEAEQAIQVQRSSQWRTTTLGGDTGTYYGRVSYSGSRPATVTVVNASDRPISTKSIPVVDAVTVESAVYDTGSGALTVTASSTDPGATLTVTGYGTLDKGTGSFQTAGPPAKVTVTSSGGGSDASPVSGTGDATPSLMLSAGIGVNGTAHAGEKVTLDGNGSTGDIDGYTWQQTAGVDTPLTVAADRRSATFIAPATPGDLTFSLTVTGPGSASDTTTATVTVLEVAAPAPVADAGPDQTVRLGSAVTLDASASANVHDYSWAQTSGSPVTLSNATATKPTFTMPATPVTFALTVTGAGGLTSTDTVTVTPLTDTLTGTARYVTSKRQWRVDGTATVTTGNRITVHAGTLQGTVIGTTTVAADGTWSIRVDNSPIPQTAAVTVESSAGAVPISIAVRAG